MNNVNSNTPILVTQYKREQLANKTFTIKSEDIEKKYSYYPEYETQYLNDKQFIKASIGISIPCALISITLLGLGLYTTLNHKFSMGTIISYEFCAMTGAVALIFGIGAIVVKKDFPKKYQTPISNEDLKKDLINEFSARDKRIKFLDDEIKKNETTLTTLKQQQEKTKELTEVKDQANLSETDQAILMMRAQCKREAAMSSNQYWKNSLQETENRLKELNLKKEIETKIREAQALLYKEITEV